MHEITDKGYRPYLFAKLRRTVRKKPTGVETLGRRYEMGLDLFTGKPLRGKDARQWLRVKAGLEEKHEWANRVVGIVAVDGNVVTVLMDDHEVRRIDLDAATVVLAAAPVNETRAAVAA